mgnify:CR=1 FL=1
MHFDLLTQNPDSKARTGRLHTEHGTIETPIFMPVGTSGSVRGVHQHELENDTKAQIILGARSSIFLPFKDLEDTLTFSSTSTEKGSSVNMASMFKEVGSTHYVPYHLMLKWGSIYHRYKKYIIDEHAYIKA